MKTRLTAAEMWKLGYIERQYGKRVRAEVERLHIFEPTKPLSGCLQEALHGLQLERHPDCIGVGSLTFTG